MNPIETFMKSYINSQDFMIQIMPEGPIFNKDYMLRTPAEKLMRKVSADYTMKIFSEVQNREKIRKNLVNTEEINNRRSTDESINNKTKEKDDNLSIYRSTTFEIEKNVKNNVNTLIKKENSISLLEEITIEASKITSKPLIENSISQSVEIGLRGKPRLSSFNNISISSSAINLQIINTKRKEYYMSYFSSFEIRSLGKIKLQNYIIKEESFSLIHFKKEIGESVVNQALSSSDFCPPKNFKIINTKGDALSQSIHDRSAFKVNTMDLKTNNIISNKYQYNSNVSDLNKSELVETDLNQTAANLHPNDLDSSIIMNKNNNEVKKTEKLIEMLNSKLEPHFDKFEKDEITPEQINEIVKKELTPLRPLFISSKNIKEKVFQALSKGNNDKYMFLNHVFKTIIEDSLKNINVKNGTYNVRPVTAANKVNTQIPKVLNEEFNTKKVIADVQRVIQHTNQTPLRETNNKMSPAKKIKQVVNTSNFDSGHNIHGKSLNLGKGVHLVNITNDKSIHTKNKINISIQPSYKKDKNDFNELPYIK